MLGQEGKGKLRDGEKKREKIKHETRKIEEREDERLRKEKKKGVERKI